MAESRWAARYWKVLLVWSVAWVIVACAWHGIPPTWTSMAEALPVVLIVAFVAAARNEIHERVRRNAAK